MHQLMLASLAATALAATSLAAVQVSNLNQNDDGVIPIPQDISPGGPMASGFVTGPGNAWRLNSVSFNIEYNGIFSADLWVQLRGFTPNFGPGGTIETLAQYTIGPGSQQIMTVSSGTILQPSTQYYIVIFSSTPLIEARMTEDNAECSTTGWTLEDYTITKNFGFWYSYSTRSLRMTIDADPIIPPPIVTSVTGCTDTPPGTIACPNSGNVLLIINGQNFRPGSVVLVGGIPSNNVSYQSSTQIICTLPPGAGRNQAVTVVDGAAVGLLTNAVSYFSPSCPGDANGDGMVNFADVAAVLASFTAACP
jgi:hypothetical protein